MTILPGLVASGGALLFGVNAWCLDARGGLWRESLPVSAGAVFVARTLVLAEFLLAASFVTLVLAGLRAGIPTGRGADRAAVHLGGRGAPGRVGRDALELAAPVRRGPAVGPGDPGTAGGDGRLLDEAGHDHHADQPDLLRSRPGSRTGSSR